MHQHGSKFFARRPLALGDGVIRSKVTFLEHGHVACQIKGNHEMVEIVQIGLFFLLNNHRKRVYRLLTMIYMMPKANLGVGETGFMFCD